MHCDHCVEALGAYVDDEMPEQERRDIDEHLAECTSCAREHDSLVRLHETLRGEGGLLRYRAPDVLKARIRGAIAQTSAFEPRVVERSPRWWQLIAAGVLIAAGSSALTLAAVRRFPSERGVAEQVLASHVRSLMPGHLTDVVSTNEHNVKPWFNGRVDLSPSVPDLSSENFTLAGGRIDYIGSRPVAVVVYTRRQHVINVYSWPAPARSGDEAMHATNLNGFHFVHWRRDGLERWAVSDLNEKELAEFVADYTRP